MSAVEVGQPVTVQGEFGGRHIRSFMLAPDKKQLTLFKEVIGMQQQHALCTGCGPPHSMCVCGCICMCVSPVTPCLCVCQFGETLAKARLFLSAAGLPVHGAAGPRPAAREGGTYHRLFPQHTLCRPPNDERCQLGRTGKRAPRTCATCLAPSMPSARTKTGRRSSRRGMGPAEVPVWPKNGRFHAVCCSCPTAYVF